MLFDGEAHMHSSITAALGPAAANPAMGHPCWRGVTGVHGPMQTTR